jgi:DNA polymerase-3 subunit epsilon
MDGSMDHFEPERLLRDTPLAIFDVETTGLSPAYGHRVCEVACLRVVNGVEEGRFESLVDPGRSITPGAFRVNRISADMLVGAPEFAAVAESLLALLEGAVLVAHNAAFDLGFLAAELEIARLPPPQGPAVDTLALARRIYHFSRNGLQAVASALGVEAVDAHRAMGDVWTTWQVLENMLEELDVRWGVTTLAGLLALQGGPIPYPHAQALPLPPAIAEALENRGQVLMRYVDGKGQESERVVSPLRVQERHGYLYLLAHCYRADALRTFRLDRVLDLLLKG